MFVSVPVGVLRGRGPVWRRRWKIRGLLIVGHWAQYGAGVARYGVGGWSRKLSKTCRRMARDCPADVPDEKTTVAASNAIVIRHFMSWSCGTPKTRKVRQISRR